MNTDTINSNNELTLEQLDNVSGGHPGAALAIVVGGAAAATFYYATTKAGNTMKEALNNGVVPREDGTDGTGHNPNSPMTSAPFA